MKLPLLIGIFLAALTAAAQNNIPASPWKGELYTEAYTRFPFSSPEPGKRISVLYNYSKQQTPDINLALAKGSYRHGALTVKAGIMAGSYSTYNLAAEPGLLKHLYEANLGWQFHPHWSVEAGVFPSHIGMESVIGKDNWNASRSLLAENSPYYETGMRLNYQPGKKWLLILLLLNGWQHIRDNNRDLAFGSQLQFRPDSTWLINSSTFIGNEMPDSSLAALRLFHNLFLTRTIGKHWNLALLFDIGAQQNRLKGGYEVWTGAGMVAQYRYNEKLQTALRMENFDDRTGVLIPTGTPHGFRVRSVTLNTDFTAGKHWMIRGEYRLFRSRDELFSNNRRRNAGFMITLAGWL